jgi:hypothetical protein
VTAALSGTQIAMRDRIAAAVRPAGATTIVYCSEWLGYLPFGVYHWVECGGTSISDDFPSDWAAADLEALERHGFLTLVTTWKDPADAFNTKVTYAVRADGGPRGTLDRKPAAGVLISDRSDIRTAAGTPCVLRQAQDEGQS